MKKFRVMLLGFILPVVLFAACLFGLKSRSPAPVPVQTEIPPVDSGLVDDSGSFSKRVLISRSEDADAEWTSRTPAAKRVRKIFPDTKWMSPVPTLKAGDGVVLALFDDAVFEAKVRNVTVYSNGAVGATAHLTGDKQGTLYLSYRDGQMRVCVEVRGGADYAVRYLTGREAHYAIEIDQEKSVILEGAEPLPVSDALLQQTAQTASDPAADPVALTDTPAGSTIVDVMIVYTPAAADWADTHEDGIETLIAQAMQRANEAHTNSNTQIYLRLVHSAEIDYAESTASNGYAVDLDRLSGTTDGYMDEVHAWRNQYGADFICLFETNNLVGGYGQLLSSRYGNSSAIFSLARVEQSSWTYTVVHEWGHNMGCHHSKTQESYPGPGLYGYSAGWQWNDPAATKGSDGFCTVMTYQNFDGDRNTGVGSGGYEYERVAYFSNPSIFYIGDSTNATGDAGDGDNARTMREMKDVLAAYRDTVVPLDDIDNDSLPNDWELLYFGSETAANTNDPAANGINTVLEAYIAGINPTNPSSFFKAALTNQNGFVVRWNATSGRVYSVFGSADLQSGFQPLETNILWPQSSWTDTVNRSESFYKVDVELE
jgi:hypothetical protein